MKLGKNPLLGAAVAGLLGAALIAQSPTAHADDKAAEKKGHCVGANGCKGKGACMQKGQNDCAGMNACKGKSYLDATKAECESMKQEAMKKSDTKKDAAKIHFETAG